ncbi:MAG TPA: helix-turn-helix domain-containing protein, partial [Candidatus Elarobacter sp.]
MSPPRSATAAASRPALVPQRRPGKQRVAALLQAGAEVFAARGYEAATMAEIAARAGAAIGSLYRFFPSKEALADALIARYREQIDETFERIESRASTTAQFADALLATMTASVRETKAAIVALLDVRPDGSVHRSEFHHTMLRHIARLLKERSPDLGDARAADMAAVLLQNMKVMKAFDAERDAGAIEELRAMTRLYL